MRKRIAVAVCCSLIFLAGWAFGQTGSRDSGDWRQASPESKLMYLVGYIHGYAQGSADGVVETTAKMLSKGPPSFTQEQKEAIFRESERVKQYSPSSVRGTLGQLIGTMDTFYADYRNAPVCWADAVRFSSASRGGRSASPEELDRARKHGSESGCE